MLTYTNSYSVKVTGPFQKSHAAVGAGHLRNGPARRAKAPVKEKEKEKKSHACKGHRLHMAPL